MNEIKYSALTGRHYQLAYLVSGCPNPAVGHKTYKYENLTYLKHLKTDKRTPRQMLVSSATQYPSQK